MDNKPLISICIPTYNRCDVLRNCLQSIVSQDIFKNNDIEIVISDNCSTDETEKVVKVFQNEYSNIYYFKNKKNICDMNFPTVLNKAHGKFRKLINDTLMLKKGCLKVIYNFVLENQNERPVILFKNSNNKNNRRIFSNKLFLYKTRNLKKILYDISFRFNWIGTLGIWDDDLYRIDTSEKYCCTKLWQVEAVYENLQLKNEYIVINNEFFLTQNKLKKNVDYSYFEVFYKNYIEICTRNIKIIGLGEKVFQRLKKDLLYNFFAKYYVESSLNFFSKEYLISQDSLYSSLKKEYSNSQWFVFKLSRFRYRILYFYKNILIKIKKVIKKLIHYHQ